MTDTFLRFLVLATAAVQIIFPYFVNPFRDGAQPVRGTEPSQIEPAEYAFAIWGPIYLLAVVYAVWQVTPAGRAAPETTRIAPLAISLYAGSSVWLAAAQYGPLWATMLVLAIMAACAVLALKLGTDITRPKPRQKSRGLRTQIPRVENRCARQPLTRRRPLPDPKSRRGALQTSPCCSSGYPKVPLSCQPSILFLRGLASSGR